VFENKESKPSVLLAVAAAEFVTSLALREGVGRVTIYIQDVA